MLLRKRLLTAKTNLLQCGAGILLLLAPWRGAGSSLSWQEALERIRANILHQLMTVSNYTCVESVDRSYLLESFNNRLGCEVAGKKPNHVYMHDRLRLDVAVSEGDEIFSWHGGKSFSSKGIDDVVRSGPVSSGSFVGYLRNVFFEPGVVIRPVDHVSANEETYSFEYVVPRAHSRYQISAKGKRWMVPFHGRFSGSATTYQLKTLRVVADNLPPESDICNASSEIEYQLVPISGKDSLIPKNYVLEIGNSNQMQTISRTDYAQCREFRGESKISFDIDDNAAAQGTPIVRDEWLPAGMILPARLRTPIDDRTSYTGDSVEADLASAVKVKNSGIVIPKGAVLSGTITKLESYSDPFKYHVVSIRFHRLTFGPNSFLLDASPLSSSASSKTLAYMYGGHVPPSMEEELKNGLFVWGSSHFHKDQHFVADWRTKGAAAEQPE